MKTRIALIALAMSFLSACVAPIDTPNTGAVVVPVPVGVPVIIKDKNKDDKDSVHVCKVKAFTETYRAENTNRGKARLDALKQCRAKHHEMFCRDEDVECTEYN